MTADGEGYSEYQDLTTQTKLSDLHVRVITVTHPQTLKKVIFALFDSNSISQLVRENLVEKIKAGIDPNFDESNLILMATHTHTGGSGMLCYAGLSASNAGFAPENIETYALNAFRAIEQAFANEKTMNIAYLDYIVPEESPLFFARSSWGAYNQNPEVIKSGNKIDATTRYKVGDRKMQLLLFIKEGKINSIIDFFGVHPNLIKEKAKQIDPVKGEVDADLMFADIRDVASRILENQLISTTEDGSIVDNGVVLYPQRGAADIDQVGYSKFNGEELINHPNAKYYFNYYTNSFFYGKDPSDPAVMSDFFTQKARDFSGMYNYHTTDRIETYARLLTYETIRAINSGELEFISGDFDSELVYVDMPSQELPTDREDYARTLNPLDYYTENEVKIPFYSMIKAAGAIIDEALLSTWLPDYVNPIFLATMIVDNTVKTMVQLIIPSSKVARTGEPIIGSYALIADMDILVNGKNDLSRYLVNPFFTALIRVTEELHYAISFLTLDRKYVRNLVSHGDEKLNLLWGGKKGYKKMAFMDVDVPLTFNFLASIFKSVHPVGAQQTQWAADGYLKKAPMLLPRIIPIQAIKFGDNIMFATAPGEVSHTLARRIENTVMAVMKDKVKRSILIDYANDYAGYWHTPEEFATLKDFYKAGGDIHHKRGIPQQLAFNLYGKWQGPVLQYNYEKLTKAMLQPKTNLDRQISLEKNFVPPFDGHKTDPSWYNAIADLGRNPEISKGEGPNFFDFKDFDSSIVSLRMIIGGLGTTAAGLIIQTTGTFLEAPVKMTTGLYDILMKPILSAVGL